MRMIDVIVIGGGPAGLAAAMMLGRCRRSVLLIDAGRPRNASAMRLHGYLTRDGVNPLRLLELGRREVERYGVQFLAGTVIAARQEEFGFRVTLEDGSSHESRKLLLATGMVDDLPAVPGFRPLYGRSVHHCPYCDGWEWRDKALAVYGRGRGGARLALKLLTWSSDVVLCTDGPADLPSEERTTLRRQCVPLREEPVARLVGRGGRLKRIMFSEGPPLARDALFFATGQRQHSELARMLGCHFDHKGGVEVDSRERTGVPGLFLAGDASRDVQFAICAAAAGATAAVAINYDFLSEEGRNG
jgi:thioredoxin reductase